MIKVFLSFCNDYKIIFLPGVILLLRGPAQNDAIYVKGVDDFVVTLFKRYSFLLFYYLTILILHLTEARCNTCCCTIQVLMEEKLKMMWITCWVVYLIYILHFI